MIFVIRDYPIVTREINLIHVLHVRNKIFKKKKKLLKSQAGAVELVRFTRH